MYSDEINTFYIHIRQCTFLPSVLRCYFKPLRCLAYTQHIYNHNLMTTFWGILCGYVKRFLSYILSFFFSFFCLSFVNLIITTEIPLYGEASSATPPSTPSNSYHHHYQHNISATIISIITITPRAVEAREDKCYGHSKRLCRILLIVFIYLIYFYFFSIGIKFTLINSFFFLLL